MTPREFFLCIESFSKRRKTEFKEKLALEWLNATWQRSKKMPSLEKIIGHEQKPIMTGREMLDKAKELNTMFGGKTY